MRKEHIRDGTGIYWTTFAQVLKQVAVGNESHLVALFAVFSLHGLFCINVHVS